MYIEPHVTTLLPADQQAARDVLEQAMTLAEAEQRSREFLEARLHEQAEALEFAI